MKSWHTAVLVIAAVFVVGGVAYHGLPQAASRDEVDALKVPDPALGEAKQPDAPAYDTSRIVATDGALTEIVYALGMGDHIVAADSTAQWPRAAAQKPSIGYVRRLSAEGILSVQPTLILNNADAGPPEVIEQIKGSGVAMFQVPGEKSQHDFETVIGRITSVADALGVAEKGRALAAAVQADIDAAREAVAGRKGPKALFVFHPAEQTIMAAGNHTAAQAFFDLVNLTNVAKGIEGFKPLSKEAIVAAAPEIIVVFTRSDKGAFEKILTVHGLAETPAGKSGRILKIDGIRFLAGGPRAGTMALEFAKMVYPGLTLPPSKSAPIFRAVEEQHGE